MTTERKEYLLGLAEEYKGYGIDKGEIFAIAGMLGEDEDYDGLVTTLEDYAESQILHGFG